MHALSADGECAGKQRMTRSQATTAALRIGIVEPYRCAHCGRWHVAGERTGRVMRRRRWTRSRGKRRDKRP